MKTNQKYKRAPIPECESEVVEVDDQFYLILDVFRCKPNLPKMTKSRLFDCKIHYKVNFKHKDGSITQKGPYVTRSRALAVWKELDKKEKTK